MANSLKKKLLPLLPNTKISNLSMIRKLLTVPIFIGLLFGLVISSAIASKAVTVHLFWAYGCPHCAHEREFLEKLEAQYPFVTVKDYEISSSRENAQLLMEVGQRLSADVSGVPFTVIGDKHFTGYLSDETTGKEIERIVLETQKAVSEDMEASAAASETEEPSVTPQPTPSNSETKAIETITLPVLGSLSIKSLPLPVLTIIIALLDGFNPCAMWVLLFLISMLLGMKDRKRMWILGSTFIVASAFVYFLFLSAWLNLFLFLGFVTWIRFLVGAFATGVGIYQVRDYFVNTTGGCQVVSSEKRTQIFRKIRQIISEKQLLFALVGIVVLAVAVNTIELVCSAGLPAIYTNVLSMSSLPMWQYYLLLLLYMLVFMLDDLVIFFIAMTTLKVVGIESKYSRYSHLIGGSLILVLGILMIVKPEWLMFG